ncbi:hypothetical protein VTK26DRAFT_6422 [Humicola hyalothermophila]
MRRYGFSTRGTLSPFGSTLGQTGVPDVTDEDYSYITSADLEDHGIDIPRQYRPHSHFVQSTDFYGHSAPESAFSQHRPEDDVMLIKHNGVTYPEHFPAYSIGDGKLLVGDVRDRAAMIHDLSERQAKRIKLFYKGRRLKDLNAPIREYGVKNNSEILMTIAEPGHGNSSDSSEDIGVVRRDEHDKYYPQGDWEPLRTVRSGRPGIRSPRSPRCPRDSAPANLGIPIEDGRRRAASRVRTQSPSGSGVGSTASTASAPATVPVGIPGGPIEKLNEIAAHFDATLRPLCADFVAQPPLDPERRVEEHRKLSETIMIQVILKLDGVETSGEEGARARRRQLVREVQAVLKDIDEAAK